MRRYPDFLSSAPWMRISALVSRHSAVQTANRSVPVIDVYKRQIRRCLIYIIIQPVRINVICMRSPDQFRFLIRIVVRIIIHRHLNIQTFAQIPLIFRIQCHSVIFRMSHHKNLTTFLCHTEEKPRLFGICQYRQSLICLHLFQRNLRMPGMRRIKRIIKSTHKQMCIRDRVNTETFTKSLSFTRAFPL